MAPNPRVVAAYRAMTVLGIKEVQVKPVLKQLLKLYDKNWELIEQENYRVLADAIFEQAEKELQGKRQKNQNNDEGEMEDEEAQIRDESVRPLKRLRLRGQENQLSIGGTSSAASPSKMPKVEDDELPQQPQYKAMSPQSNRNAETEVRPVPVKDSLVDKGKQPLSSQDAPGGRRVGSERASPSAQLKEPTTEQRIVVSQKNQLPYNHELIIPKDEPIDELVHYDAPMATINHELPSGRDPPMQHDATRKQGRNGPLMSKRRDVGRGEGIRDSSNEANHEVATNQECSTIEIASSKTGEGEEGSEMMTSSINVLKESKTCDALVIRGNTEDLGMHAGLSNGSINIQSSSALAASHISISPPLTTGMNDAVLVTNNARSDFPECEDGKELEDPKRPHSGSLVVVQQHQLTPDDLRVVQRGITFNLQVFFTSEGKGWGLRTLEELPKASYGNVARFINHRCFDANLIPIPVEVETSDHHYFHLAFFTSRKIAALEELTWDYGIDFDDYEGLVKPFSCRCGSKFCRKMERSNRSNRSVLTA
ncbi:hypothetical protein K1719_010023 [Acacia pycnantha]|nr:hypothetical protein K1719_032187 [Acacia pycnantha]KAI9119348.1 hypothetical protein K1719_010023 [Acacia pycnantha]